MGSSLYERFADAAARFPDRVAVAPADCPPLTYAELRQRVDAFAMELHQAGIGEGRVGVLLPNVASFPVVFYALQRVGASALLLNPLYASREIAEYAADAGVTRVVTIEALEHLLPAGLAALVVDPVDCGAEQRGGSLPPLTHAAPEDEAAVIYTAAMDGWARGARLTHRSLGSNLSGVLEAMQLVPDDNVFALLPFAHAFGLTVTLTAPLSAGATVVPVERFHAVRSVDLLEASQATVVCGVPAMYLALIAAAERRGVPIHRLRVAICGGAPLRPEVSRRWEDTFGLPLREGYGLTEASPVCLFNRVDQPNRPGTLGFPFPGVEVSLRDGRGQIVPRGEVGEICVTGANLFAGYLGDEGRDPRDFFDTAFRTGDLGSQDPTGAVRFRGVRKPMFTRSGYNIYPREIERVVMADPRVAQASVTPLPDAAKENEIELSVAPAPGAELDEAAVREICRAGLASYKQPGTIVVEGS
jgi:long-chain acyl-CoA synthetase